MLLAKIDISGESHEIQSFRYDATAFNAGRASQDLGRQFLSVKATIQDHPFYLDISSPVWTAKSYVALKLLPRYVEGANKISGNELAD